MSKCQEGLVLALQLINKYKGDKEMVPKFIEHAQTFQYYENYKRISYITVGNLKVMAKSRKYMNV